MSHYCIEMTLHCNSFHIVILRVNEGAFARIRCVGTNTLELTDYYYTNTSVPLYPHEKLYFILLLYFRIL